jgi:hypothetical protein
MVRQRYHHGYVERLLLSSRDGCKRPPLSVCRAPGLVPVHACSLIRQPTFAACPNHSQGLVEGRLPAVGGGSISNGLGKYVYLHIWRKLLSWRVFATRCPLAVMARNKHRDAPPIVFLAIFDWLCSPGADPASPFPVSPIACSTYTMRSSSLSFFPPLYLLRLACWGTAANNPMFPARMEVFG